MTIATWNQIKSLQVGSKVLVSKESEYPRPGLNPLVEGRAVVTAIKKNGMAIISQLQGGRFLEMEILCDPGDFEGYGIEILDDPNRKPEAILLQYTTWFPYPGQLREAVDLEPVGTLRALGIKRKFRGKTALERARQTLKDAGYEWNQDVDDLIGGAPEVWNLVKP